MKKRCVFEKKYDATTVIICRTWELSQFECKLFKWRAFVCVSVYKFVYCKKSITNTLNVHCRMHSGEIVEINLEWYFSLAYIKSSGVDHFKSFQWSMGCFFRFLHQTLQQHKVLFTTVYIFSWFFFFFF